MMRSISILSVLLLSIWAFLPAPGPQTDWRESSVAQVLQALGADTPAHLPNTTLEGVSVEAGRKLVHEGIAIAPKGLDADRQSKHFLCTSCHNTEQEDPDLRLADPEARLTYAIENDLPFLPGTTLYGVVNRESYYNGDYEKKYGDLVRPARHDLRGAIQLCATECAQGRALEDWEMESILAYLWTIDLKVADLQLPAAAADKIKRAVNGNGAADAAQTALKAAYLPYSPATFIIPPADRQLGYPNITPRPERGKEVYERSCLHCHAQQRYAFFHLDDSAYNARFLTKHFPRYTRYSVYQVGRYGTSPIPGKKAYMPHYTAERMSAQQMEDLRAYLAQLSAGT